MDHADTAPWIWSCGHAHTYTSPSAIATCAPAWLIRVFGRLAGDRYCDPAQELRDGDYVLYQRCSDGLYQAVSILHDTTPLRLADRDGRRLMLWDTDHRIFFPVMP